MSRLVIDSSVVIKWFVPEMHSTDALRYLDPDLERDAPELLLAEVSNILWNLGRGWAVISGCVGHQTITASRS